MITKRIHQSLLIKSSAILRNLLFEHSTVQNVLYYTTLACKNVSKISNKSLFSSNNIFKSKNVEKKYKIIRSCHETSVQRTYQLNESLWFHEKMENSPAYANTVTSKLLKKNVSEENAEKLLSVNWDSMLPEDLVTNFEIISFYINQKGQNYQDLNYQHILESVTNSCANLNNDQINNILMHFQLWYELRKGPSYLQCFQKLDENCLQRHKIWSLEEKLKTCDLFFWLLNNKSRSFWTMMRKLGSKLSQMSLPNLIHYIFLLNTNKKCPQNMYEIEYHAEKYLNAMNIHEIAIVALCFYKRKTQTRSKEFLAEILNKSLKNINNMESFNVAAIMKFIRSFRNLEVIDEFNALLKGCESILPKLNMMCLTHILHAAANMTLYEKKLMSLILERFVENLSEVRIKDIERLTFVLSVFNYGLEHPIYKKIINELRNSKRSDELESFAKCVPYTLMYLVQSGMYPRDLIEKVMHPDYIMKVYDSVVYKIGLEYLFLDQSIEIEMPDYTGPRLIKQHTELLSKHFKSEIPNFSTSKISSHNKIMLDVIYECRKIVGDSGVVLDHILPHYLKPDIIIALDKDGKSLPVGEIMPIVNGIKYIPEEYRNETKWLALIIGSNFSCISGTCIGTGFTMSKIRQLRHLGYIPILIPYGIWDNISNGKKTYLESLLFSNPSMQNVKRVVVY